VLITSHSSQGRLELIVVHMTSTTILPPKLPAQPALPRLSATLIVVNAYNEILLVQRNKTSSDFSGATVFPGGNFDSKQDESLEDTAIRETFEETGLLLVSDSLVTGEGCILPSRRECDAARDALHTNKVSFKQFLRRHGLAPATQCLKPFSSWVTPPNYPKRFRTQFFVVFLADVFPDATGEGRRQQYELLPDKREIASVRFMHCVDASQAFKEHKLSIPTPQAYNIATLADILKSRSSTPEEQTRVCQLSASIYGRMTLHPLLLTGDGYKGRIIFTYEGDETRGGPYGQLHRSVDWMDEGMYISSDTLHRNFDVSALKQEWFDKYSPKL